MALCGLSEEYRLNKIAEHLQVPIDTWFDWSEYRREDYVAKFNAMSVDDAIQRKAIRVAQHLMEIGKSNEYKQLSADVAVVLKENKKYKNELVTAVVEGALELLNHPTASSKKATIDLSKNQRYEVASKKSQHREVECTLNTNHVSCRCASYKYDSVFKHSIAVAEKVGILEQHLKQTTKASRIPGSGRRSSLVEANVNKNVAGKKGAKSEYPYRPPSSETPERAQAQER